MELTQYLNYYILIEVEAATIFAPSDGAFAKLPAEILEGLTMEQKRAIVSRHVVAGRFDKIT